MDNVNGFENQDNVLHDNNIREGIRNLALDNPNNVVVNAGNNEDMQEVVVHQHQDVGNQRLAGENHNNGGRGNGQQQNPRAHANNLQDQVQHNAVNQHQVNHPLFDRQQHHLAIQNAPVNLRIGGQGNQPGFQNQNFERDGNNRQEANVFGRHRNNNALANPQGGQGNLLNIDRFNIDNPEVLQNIGNIPQNVNHFEVAGPHVQQPNLAVQNQNGIYQGIHPQNNNSRNQNPQLFHRQNATNNRSFPYSRPNRNVQMRQNCDKMASFLWSMAKQTTYVPQRRDNHNNENYPDA